MECHSSLGSRLSSDPAFAFTTLSYVFTYLDLKDLLNCSRVCKTWQWITKHDFLWSKITVTSCSEDLNEILNSYISNISKLEILNTNSIPPHHFRSLWNKMVNLKQVYLHQCNKEQLTLLAENCSTLDKLYVRLTDDVESFDCLTKIKDIIHLSIWSEYPILDVRFLQDLNSLRHLSLISPTRDFIWEEICKMENLTTLCLSGQFDSIWIEPLFETNFFIRQLSHLNKLEICDLSSLHETEILIKLKMLPNLKELSLTDISISRAGVSNFGSLLGECKNIENFAIRLKREVFYRTMLDVALENYEVIKGVALLRQNLKHFCWKMDQSGVSKPEKYYNRYNVTATKQEVHKNNKTHMEVIPITLDKLFRLLRKILPNSKLILLHPKDDKAIKRTCYRCNYE